MFSTKPEGGVTFIMEREQRAMFSAYLWVGGGVLYVLQSERSNVLGGARRRSDVLSGLGRRSEILSSVGRHSNFFRGIGWLSNVQSGAGWCNDIWGGAGSNGILCRARETSEVGQGGWEMSLVGTEVPCLKFFLGMPLSHSRVALTQLPFPCCSLLGGS